MHRKHESAPATTDRAWEELGLAPAQLAAVARAKFKHPTDTQVALIPPALAGHDVLGQARTGTGKTAAFTLPMLQRLEHEGGLQALVLVPTRELAVQVEDHVRLLATDTPFRTVAILGGRQIKTQVAALRRNPEIAIGTPGRVLDLLHRKELSFAKLKFVVLDEVDRMLDIGFRDDIRKILRTIAHPHQTIFVSATIDEEIQKLAKSYMHEPLEVDVSRDMLTVEGVQQCYMTVHPLDKFPTLVNLLKHEAPSLAIVFTNTKHKARRVTQSLKHEGVNCKEIHGDLTQERRERVMKAFRDGKLHVLVATDLAARGLDVMDISHIINYDIPQDTAVYVHRIGRTARMGRSGRAITFVTREEGKLLTEVEKLINQQVPEFAPDWLVKRPPTLEEELAAAATKAAPPPAKAADGSATPERYLAPRQRDEVLDSLGYRPVKRTLGSRFRSPRKFRR
jgi:ATP-dependent RNA helicase DeaD